MVLTHDIYLCPTLFCQHTPKASPFQILRAPDQQSQEAAALTAAATTTTTTTTAISASASTSSKSTEARRGESVVALLELFNQGGEGGEFPTIKNPTHLAAARTLIDDSVSSLFSLCGQKLSFLPQLLEWSGWRWRWWRMLKKARRGEHSIT